MALAWSAVAYVIDLLSTPCLVSRKRKQNAPRQAAAKMSNLVQQEIAKLERDQNRLQKLLDEQQVIWRANVERGESAVVTESDRATIAKYEGMLDAIYQKLDVLHRTRDSISTNLSFRGTVAETFERYQTVVRHITALRSEETLSKVAENLEYLLQQSDYAAAIHKSDLFTNALQTESRGDEEIPEPDPEPKNATYPDREEHEIILDDHILNDPEYSLDMDSIPLMSATSATFETPSSSSASSRRNLQSLPTSPRPMQSNKKPSLNIRMEDIFSPERVYLKRNLLAPPPFTPSRRYNEVTALILS